LPPLVCRGGQGEKSVVNWAEACAVSLPAKSNSQGCGRDLLDLEYTTSEQELMDNLGENPKETDARCLSESNGFYSTAERQLLAEIDVAASHANPNDELSVRQQQQQQQQLQQQQQQPRSRNVST